MAAIAMMLGGALVNAFAFTGSSYLFSMMRHKDDENIERKRHDLAVEQLQQAQADYSKRRTERIDWVKEELHRQNVAVQNFESVDQAMRAYAETHPSEPELGPEPTLTDFYTPSDDQKNMELAFVALSMAAIGAGSMWLFRD